MIIVTGASSYVGRNFLRKFKSKNILCLVRNKIPELKVRQEIVDFHKSESIEKFIKKNDTIIHIAGITDGSKSEIYSVNYGITKNLIDTGKVKKIKRFIFISSYIAEMKEKGDYGKSKLAAERYLKGSGLEYIILRPSLIYGRDEKKFVGKMVWFIKKNKFIPVMGDGEYSLRTVYIEDLVEVIGKSIDSKKKNKTYYVTSKDSVSVNQRYKIISEILNKKLIIIHIPIFLLKMVSPIVRIIKKDFPSIEQLNRIISHENYSPSETEKDFNINFTNFKKGIEKTLKEI